MQAHRMWGGRILWIVLCCLVPPAALAATLFLNTPVLPTALCALVLLIPLAYRVLAEI